MVLRIQICEYLAISQTVSLLTSSYVYLCSKFMCYEIYERHIDFAKQEPHHFLREMQRKNNSLVFCT